MRANTAVYLEQSTTLAQDTITKLTLNLLAPTTVGARINP